MNYSHTSGRTGNPRASDRGGTFVRRVAADPAVVPQARSPSAYRRLAYFRLHGPRIYHSTYDQAFLETVALKLMSAMEAGADVWCVFGNTADGAAICNALDFRSLLATGLAF